MVQDFTGEFAALATAIFWTITALAFESASLKVGSLSVNIIRLLIGFLFLTIFVWIRRGMLLPFDASVENWIWLTISGLIGFVFGDLLLFKSYTIIGSRFSMLIMTLVPPITALLGFLILNEKLTFLNYFGIILTFAGIAMAIFSKGQNNKLSLKLAPTGILYALGGALGQAAGLVLSKLGMDSYDPFASTQIRIISGMAGFLIVVTVLGRWSKVGKALKNRKGMAGIVIGSFFGPFLGVSFSLLSVKFTETGIAATIMSLVPILIIPAVYILYRQKIKIIEIIGAIISVIGVSLFFIR